MGIKRYLSFPGRFIRAVSKTQQDRKKSKELKKRNCYAKYYKHAPVQSDVILYESFFGRGMLGNPYAIFLRLLEDEEGRKKQHVWVLDQKEDNHVLRECYKDKSNVRFIERESREYFRYLASAGYLINNVTFPYYFSKKKGQVYINTWHGIPLKALGFDMPNGNIETANTIRNFMHADYLISASPFLTQIYEKAFKLEGIYQGKIIEEGYPRLDRLANFSKTELIEKLHRYHVALDPSKKVILYAPTWRGASYREASGDVSGYYEFKAALEAQVDTSEYQILVKVHQRVYQLARTELTDDFFIPAMVDANEVLALTDILISDFSSIYFDFLATGRPVLFYIQDAERYQQERGLYQGLEKLPGPCGDTVEQLAGWIRDIGRVQEEYRDAYERMQEWSNVRTAGQSAERIVDIIWKGKRDGYRIHTVAQGKKKVFFSRGVMAVNGISTSFLNLLNELDYEKLDVSVMVSDAKDMGVQLVEQINEHARVFYRNSTWTLTFWEHMIYNYLPGLESRKKEQELFLREWKRCYGDAAFDCAVDYEGYNTYFARLVADGTAKEKLIWMHNDMASEREMKYDWLERLFRLYRCFDGIVSCSYDIMLVNREKLSGVYADADRFRYARNFVDQSKILSGAKDGKIVEYEGKRYLLLQQDEDGGCLLPRLIPYIPETDPAGEPNYRFVNIGRMSPEKNQLALLRAFARLLAEHPNVYLYLIGNGTLKKKLLQCVEELGLEGHVLLTGNISNPYYVLRQCDCFVLPSLHEGQPMVVNEARVLGLPIVMSEFSSVNGVLVDGGQLLIGTEEDEIYEGLKRFLQGQVPTDYRFDAKQYNEETRRELWQALGL